MKKRRLQSACALQAAFPCGPRGAPICNPLPLLLHFKNSAQYPADKPGALHNDDLHSTASPSHRPLFTGGSASPRAAPRNDQQNCGAEQQHARGAKTAQQHYSPKQDGQLPPCPVSWPAAHLSPSLDKASYTQDTQAAAIW